MKIKFWGTRGSLPASMMADRIRNKITKVLQAAQGQELDTPAKIDQFIDKLPFAVKGSYGTNTPCVEIDNPGGAAIICDAGSGIRDVGVRAVKKGDTKEYHIFLTHLHWDHIQGFPFFAPAFVEGNKITIHTYHPETEDCFRMQMHGPVFPIPLDALPAEIIFDLQPPCTPYEIEGFKITAKEQNHPGTSYGYRFEKAGKAFVYSTDSEHKEEAYDQDYPFIDFFRDADLLVFDAQYNLTDATFAKANWGHSSNVIGVELAARAQAKRLALFHHEPTSSDTALEEFLHNTEKYFSIYHQESAEEKQYPLEIMLAYDGLEIEL